MEKYDKIRKLTADYDSLLKEIKDKDFEDQVFLAQLRGFIAYVGNAAGEITNKYMAAKFKENLAKAEEDAEKAKKKEVQSKVLKQAGVKI